MFSCQSLRLQPLSTEAKLDPYPVPPCDAPPQYSAFPSGSVSGGVTGNGPLNLDNIVFFSRHVKDPHSLPFLAELAKISSEKDIKRYCIGITGGNRELLRLLGITHVPTIVVDGVMMHGPVAWGVGSPAATSFCQGGS